MGDSEVVIYNGRRFRKKERQAEEAYVPILADVSDERSHLGLLTVEVDGIGPGHVTNSGQTIGCHASSGTQIHMYTPEGDKRILPWSHMDTATYKVDVPSTPGYMVTATGSRLAQIGASVILSEIAPKFRNGHLRWKECYQVKQNREGHAHCRQHHIRIGGATYGRGSISGLGLTPGPYAEYRTGENPDTKMTCALAGALMPYTRGFITAKWRSFIETPDLIPFMPEGFADNIKDIPEMESWMGEAHRVITDEVLTAAWTDIMKQLDLNTLRGPEGPVQPLIFYSNILQGAELFAQSRKTFQKGVKALRKLSQDASTFIGVGDVAQCSLKELKDYLSGSADLSHRVKAWWNSIKHSRKRKALRKRPTIKEIIDLGVNLDLFDRFVVDTTVADAQSFMASFDQVVDALTTRQLRNAAQATHLRTGWIKLADQTTSCSFEDNILQSALTGESLITTNLAERSRSTAMRLHVVARVRYPGNPDVSPLKLWLRQVGITRPLSSCWDLIPFSFVLDYFTKLEQFFARFDDALSNDSLMQFPAFAIEQAWVEVRKDDNIRVEVAQNDDRNIEFFAPYGGGASFRNLKDLSLNPAQLAIDSLPTEKYGHSWGVASMSCTTTGGVGWPSIGVNLYQDSPLKQLFLRESRDCIKPGEVPYGAIYQVTDQLDEEAKRNRYGSTAYARYELTPSKVAQINSASWSRIAESLHPGFYGALDIKLNSTRVRTLAELVVQHKGNR